MADLTISKELAERLQRIAQSERVSVEDVLTTLVTRYEHDTGRSPVPAGPADEDIDVPDDIQDKEAFRAAVRQVRPKLYRIARDYWRKVGDQERLALTDAELDKQFWLIDPDGIPRLKSEQGTIEIPPDPLDAFIRLFPDSNVTDASTTVRETMADYYRKKYDRSD